MQIGELFVSLGIKNGDKTKDTLEKTDKGVKGIASSAFAAKAAAVGMLYALEQLSSSSAHAGGALANFTALTGVSGEVLQRYQWAAQKAHVTNEQVAQSFKGLEDAMTGIRLDGKLPDFFQEFGNALHRHIDMSDIEKWSQDSTELMGLVNQFYAAEPDKRVAERVISGLGASPMLPAFARGVITDKNLAAAPVYGDGQIKALDRLQTRWDELQQRIRMAIGNFSALHGGEIVTDVEQLTDAFFKLAEQVEKSGAITKFFDAIKLSFEGWGEIFKGVSELNEFLKNREEYQRKKDEEEGKNDPSEQDLAPEYRGNKVSAETKATVRARAKWLKDNVEDPLKEQAEWMFGGSNFGDIVERGFGKAVFDEEDPIDLPRTKSPKSINLLSTINPLAGIMKSVAPPLGFPAPNGNGPVTTTVNQTLNVQGVKDAPAVGREAAKAVKNVIQTSPANAGGT